MSKTTVTSTISKDYAQRITDDLSTNRGEQERVRTELTRLQGELLLLEEGEQVLVKMQEVLGDSGKPAARQGEGRTTASVPTARRPRSKTTSQKRSRTSKPHTPTEAEAPESGAMVKGSSEPTWRELVTAYLNDQREPKSAAEVTAALTESNPQRRTQVTVVRNTLEQGVAHGLLERSKQGRSVYYSPVPTPTAATSVTPAESAQ
ncbi:hypothetical protein [Streptomyces sp. NBC_01185]|uniref:hypothetical protein n=1 Tax=Streptomyces sp. NBC_01185 TaxID=2903764 RepID=UPI00386E51C7|nr:hypothetical protein OG770_37120 [Streptomyces sp. NBC_01185]